MPVTKSILRYPGGKTQLSKFVRHIIKINNIHNPIYCEVFCGGAGIAIDLLLSGEVHSIILNDLDPAIYSIWNATINETDHFIDKYRTHQSQLMNGRSRNLSIKDSKTFTAIPLT